MTNDIQVSLWIGTDEPPTKYHIWIYNWTEMRHYDFTNSKWVAFLDINENSSISALQTAIATLQANTINGYKISSNPTLSASDILTNKQGIYINSTDKTSDALGKIDELLTTKVF